MVKRDNNKEKGRGALDGFREEIDQIDGQIVSLLSRRQEIASEIGKVKRDLGIEIIDPDREHEVLRGLLSKSRRDLSPRAIRSIFSEIISAARSVQQGLTVAYLGPEATFSHQAAICLFGRSASFLGADTIEEVFGLVENGTCQEGVVPIENSFEGSVNSTLDLFYEYEVKIRAEIFLRIRHHLMSRVDHIEDIKRLYSHPMPMAQCRAWIKTHLGGVPVTEVASTSLAAKMAADEPEAAAVGSRLAGHTYGLNTLEENIEDHPDNITRFCVIGKNQPEPTGGDKTSLLFNVIHKPGALHKSMEPLARRNINMLRIESRPMKTRNWEYLFFMDIGGHEQDGNVSGAIKEMEKHCTFIKRLGSYPAGDEPWD
jgi:chorismate mutase/prephenate dehydratase